MVCLFLGCVCFVGVFFKGCVFVFGCLMCLFLVCFFVCRVKRENLFPVLLETIAVCALKIVKHLFQPRAWRQMGSPSDDFFLNVFPVHEKFDEIRHQNPS